MRTFKLVFYPFCVKMKTMIIKLEHFKASVIEKQCSQTHSVILLKITCYLKTQDSNFDVSGLHASTRNKMSQLWSIGLLQAHEKWETKTGHGYLVTRVAFFFASRFFIEQSSIICNQCGKSAAVKPGCGSYDAILAGLRYTPPPTPPT